MEDALETPIDHEPLPRSGWTTFGAALLVWLGSLALYVLTAMPGVGFGPDATRQLAAVTGRLGATAVDQPLFTALGWLATRILTGQEPAFVVTLVAALASSLTVLIVFLTGLRLTDKARLGTPRSRALFAAGAALSLAVAHGFWLRAVTPAPAAVATLLFATIVWLWIRRLAGGGAWNIVCGTLLLGLATAADVGLVLFAPLLWLTGVWLLWRPQNVSDRLAHRRRSLPAALGTVMLAWIVGTLPLLALEGVATLQAAAGATSRGNAAVEALRTVGAGLVNGRLRPLTPNAELAQRLADVGLTHLYNFPLIPIVLALIGALVLLVRRGAVRSGWLLVALALIGLVATGAVPVLDLGGSVLPLAVISALWTAVGLSVLIRRATPLVTALVALLLVGVPVALYVSAPSLPGGEAARARLEPLVTADPTLAAAGVLQPWRCRFDGAGIEARTVLDAVPPSAVLIVAEDGAARLLPAIRYVQAAQDDRADIEVHGVAAVDTTTLARALAPVLARTRGHGPTYVAVTGPHDTADELVTIAPRLQTLADGKVYGLLETNAAEIDRLAGPRPGPAGADSLASSSDVSLIAPGVVPGNATHRWRLSDRAVATVDGDTLRAGTLRVPWEITPRPAAPDSIDHGTTGDPDAEPGQRPAPPGPAGADETAVPSDASRALARADSLFEGGQYAAAVRHYGAVIGNADDARRAERLSRNALARYAVALEQSGAHTKARAVTQQVYATARDSVIASMTLGQLYTQAGNLDQAILLFTRVTEARPDSPTAHRLLGSTLYSAGDFAAAHTSLERAWLLDPNDGDALYLLGRASEELDDLEGARAAYMRYTALGQSDHLADVRRRLQLVITRMTTGNGNR